MRYFEVSDRSRVIRKLYTQNRKMGAPRRKDVPGGNASSFIPLSYEFLVGERAVFRRLALTPETGV